MSEYLKLAAAVILQLSIVVTAFGGLGGGVKDEDSARPLKWRGGGPLQISISSSLTRQAPNIKHDSDVAGAVRRSLQTWQRYLDFELNQTTSEKQRVSPAAARGDGISLITIAPTAENALLFSDGLQESAAATRVFYDKRGFISEADIVLNPYQQFSTDGTVGTFDLESTLTHEIGHLLGLEHSDVLGATMHEKYGKNGAYGLSSYSARTLSQDDISALQRLYGAKGETACCSNIAGKLTSADGKDRQWQVWAEDTQSGQVRAVATTDAVGNFNFHGLSSGNVLLFAQDRAGDVVSRGELGTVTAPASESASINKNVRTAEGKFKLEYLGFNGQLSDIAVALNPGKVYTIYLGGRNLDSNRLVAGFTSPYLSVERNSIRTLDFGSEISVISIDVRIDERTPAGDYSVFVAGEDGLKRYIVGGITIEGYLNPWSKFNLTSD